MSVIWHDLECGAYTADIPLWRGLAAECDGPILDIGAGTGRITLDLARHGHDVTALDRDPELLAELERRADGLTVTIVVADARDFSLDESFALCIVPMQTVQLLGGEDGRARFLRCARAHLRGGGRLALAIAEVLDVYDVAGGIPAPVPDMCEIDGVLYASQPTAVRANLERFVLERRRDTISPSGQRQSEADVVVLDRVSARQLEHEAAAAGFRRAPRASVPPTTDYVGSTVVMLTA